MTGPPPAVTSAAADRTVGAVGRVILRVLDVSREFPSHKRGGLPVRAVSHVSIDLHEGEVLGIVGESGCGKTTLVRCLLGLIPPTAGRIEVDGHDLTRASDRERRRLRRDLQVVFQDPVGSLDPRLAVRDLVAEPLRTHEGGRRVTDDELVLLLEEVGLSRAHLERLPHELSGGQCQRVAIARALALRPRIVVLDEPTSSLDVSVQAQILNLLAELRRRHGLTYLLVTHDLAVVRHLTDRVAVMYLGAVVELAPTEELYGAPRHPYTRALLAAAPSIDRGAGEVLTRGDPPGAGAATSGCAFHPRCWLRDQLGRPEICAATTPVLASVGGVRTAACHFPDRVIDQPQEVTS
jgi:peptide/nickel transport system ATP-binding protein